jgi:hypothetical protein
MIWSYLLSAECVCVSIRECFKVHRKVKRTLKAAVIAKHPSHHCSNTFIYKMISMFAL